MFLTSDHVADGFPPPSRVGVLETVGQDGQASRPLGGHSRPDCGPHSFATYLKPVTMYRCQLPQTNSGAQQSQIWSGAEAPSPSGGPGSSQASLAAALPRTGRVWQQATPCTSKRPGRNQSQTCLSLVRASEKSMRGNACLTELLECCPI